jgi:hypothetical protein
VANYCTDEFSQDVCVPYVPACNPKETNDCGTKEGYNASAECKSTDGTNGACSCTSDYDSDGTKTVTQCVTDSGLDLATFASLGAIISDPTMALKVNAIRTCINDHVSQCAPGYGCAELESSSMKRCVKKAEMPGS